MIKATIKKDKYSLYFKIDQMVYRPIQTDDTYETYGHLLPIITLTRFREGRCVIVRTLSNGVATARIEGSQQKEKWFFHGEGRSSGQWKPCRREFGS